MSLCVIDTVSPINIPAVAVLVTPFPSLFIQKFVSSLESIVWNPTPIIPISHHLKRNVQNLQNSNEKCRHLNMAQGASGQIPRRGGVYFADGMCTPSRVSFSPSFFNVGIKRRQFFWSRLSEAVFCKCKLLFRHFPLLMLLFGVYFQPMFSKARYHLEETSLKPGEKSFLGVHIPVPVHIKSSALPPRAK